MSLKPNEFHDGNPDAWEYMEAAAIEGCCVGMALTVTNGKLAKATGGTKPSYISMYGKDVQDGETIPVIRVHEETRFLTQFSADASALKVGDKVTLDATGTMATATTADGVLEIIKIYGTDIGDDVLVRIP